VKFLLVIPALMLFLSNIPFIHKMDMKEMMAVMKKSGCCKKQQAGEVKACHSEVKAPAPKPSCGMAAEEPASCHSPGNTSPAPGESAKNLPGAPEDEKCPVQHATCVCICCFQYAAPDQVAAKLQFGLAGNNNNLAGYLQQHWKDPHLTAPWQPPDLV
jgi:hypothetical protein